MSAQQMSSSRVPGRPGVLLDQEPEQSLEGPAFWSFGGGGMRGDNTLEGTFLGGCLFSGRIAGRAAAAATA